MAVFLTLVFACAPPPKTIAVIQSPTPSPSPTPTTALAAAGPGFHAGEVGLAYPAASLTATGGIKPYMWSVAGGALPAGLILGGDGTVSGNPTSAGHYVFTIQAADSGDSKATVAGTINIASRLTAALIPACATNCSVELGCANACGLFGQVAGGVAPFSYTVKQGQLPAGTKLSPNSLSLTGTFGGKPGYLQFTVQVADGFGATTTLSPTFWMYPHVSLAGGTCQGRVRCSVTLAFAGGPPGPQPTVAPAGWAAGNCGFTASFPCPEPNFSATYQAGKVTVTLAYQANYPATSGTLTVRITDGNPCAAGVHCNSTAAVTVIG